MLACVRESEYTRSMTQRRVVLVRGLPGSGKSTWVREQIKDLAPGTFAWCSNDHYFEETGLAWTEDGWKKAKAITRAKITAAYADPQITRIFIDNVHATLKTIRSMLYGIHAEDVEVVDFAPRSTEFHHRRTIHNVPWGRVNQFRQAWDRISFTRRFDYKHTRMTTSGD